MRCLLAPLLAACGALPALGAGQPSPAVTVSLIDGWRTADGGRVAAVVVELPPGWHTYWRVPGEAGIPPRFDWSASSNLASVAYEWPRPEVFDRFGLLSFGYDDELVLPVRLAPEVPAAVMDVALTVEIGVCGEICVPIEAQVTAALEGDGSAGDRARIEAALAERAVAPAEAGVARVTCGLVSGTDGLELAAQVTFAAAPAKPPQAVLEAGQPNLWVGATASVLEGATLVASAPVEAAGGGGPMLERRAFRLTLIESARAVDIRGCDAPTPPAPG
jgi:DsbC/DsbD-like thiol-disulfide interchange protein